MPTAQLADDVLFAELETAAGVPLPPDLRASILILCRAESWRPTPLPNTRETIEFWNGLAKHALGIIELVEGNRGRAKSGLPGHPPQSQLVADGLDLTQWWKETSDLLETIAMTAKHQADRDGSKRRVKFWTKLATSASAIIELVEGERGRALAVREALATLADYRSKGWLPEHLPQTQLVTDGLNWDQWWQATSDLLETIALSAQHQATRARSERKGQRGRRPLTTVLTVRDHLSKVYHHAVADYRKSSGIEPANREEAFIKAVSEHLPVRLRGQSAEANASRPRKEAATRKHRSKASGSRSKG